MKKSIIAASASAAALAAMPILGAFAASGNSFKDTLTINVNGGCTIENADIIDDGDAGTDEPDAGAYVDREFEATIAAGTIGYLNISGQNPSDTSTPTPSTDAPAFTIICNAGAPDPSQPDAPSIASWTVSVTANDLVDGSNSITPGSTFEGAASHYGIKSNANYAEGANVTNPYATYTYNSSSTTFLSADNGVSVTFNPSYKVYVSPSQEVGEYTGDVVYTVTQP